MTVISKSSYIRGIKCHKSLYLHFIQPEVRDTTSEQQQNIFSIGHDIGSYAQQLFDGGIDASRGNPLEREAAVSCTRELIESGKEVIYEAAFYDGENMCYLDILVKRGGEWHAIEVKASTEVKDYHRDDVAFQYFVITRSGLPLAGISLMHINNKYVRKGELDLAQLFTSEDLTEESIRKQEQVSVNLLLLRNMLAAGIEPDVQPGSQCSSPYECDFCGYCNRDKQWYPLCDLKGINQAKAQELHELGVKSFDDIPDDFHFTDKEWDLAHAEFEQKEVRNEEALAAFTGQLEYPLYYMDFETIMPAVPMYDENRPYQQIPFQYSLHIQETPGGAVRHYEWLGTPSADPRPEFANTLIKLLGTHGSIVTYNKAFECSRLREIARDFPQYSEAISNLLPRIIDLMSPFRSRHLYHPAMKGSYSIKAVLPAYINDVSYHDLEIQEGGTASLTYLSLYQDSDIEIINKKREDLLKYCGLDTMAMVRLMGVVYQLLRCASLTQQKYQEKSRLGQ